MRSAMMRLDRPAKFSRRKAFNALPNSAMLSNGQTLARQIPNYAVQFEGIPHFSPNIGDREFPAFAHSPKYSPRFVPLHLCNAIIEGERRLPAISTTERDDYRCRARDRSQKKRKERHPWDAALALL
jgi:hypothetical protein